MKTSIRIKFFYGLIIVFLGAYIFSIVAVSKTLQSYNYQIIKREMKSQANNINLYIKQYIKTNELEWNSSIYRKSVENFGVILSNKFNERLVIYDEKGGFLFDSVNDGGYLGDDDNGEDIQIALDQNNSAFSIMESENKYIISLSVPLKNYKGEKGVLRVISDYTFMLDESKSLYRIIMGTLIVVFIVLFLFTWLLSKVITRPLINLNKASRQISKGDFDYSIKLSTGDEIEELADSMNIMKEEIKTQIVELKSERDNLMRVHKHRKLFFDNITHDMKTPLTIISGYIQILLNGGIENKEFSRAKLENIKGQTEKLHGLILDLLEGAKAESELKYNFEEFDMSDMMSNVLKNMKVAAENKKIVLESDIQEGVKLLGDKGRLNQAIVNIIDNGIKYSNEDTKIKIILYKEDSNCIIEIIDRGIGIEAEDLNRIFEPYYTRFQSEKESTGLGLYIVNVIIKKHMGEITVRSRKNEGTRVLIKLPLEGNYLSR